MVEYGQLFAASFIIVVCSTWVGLIIPRMADQLGKQGRTLTSLAEGALALRWAGLILLPLFLLAVWRLKQANMGRAPVIATSVAFSFAALAWVALAMYAVWSPLM